MEKQAIELGGLGQMARRAGAALGIGGAALAPAAHALPQAMHAVAPAAEHQVAEGGAHLLQKLHSMPSPLQGVPSPLHDPDVLGAGQQLAQYHRLPLRTKMMLHKSDLVQAGVPPHIAATLGGWSRSGAESPAGAIARHAALGGGESSGKSLMTRAERKAARGAAAASAEEATKMGSIMFNAFADELMKIAGMMPASLPPSFMKTVKQQAEKVVTNPNAKETVQKLRKGLSGPSRQSYLAFV